MRVEHEDRLRPRVVGPLDLLALTALLTACGHEPRPRAPEAAPAGAPRAVRLAEVRRDGGAGEQALPATVRARRRAVLAARLPATVVELPRREGESVAQGELLVRLEDGALRSAVAAAESALRAAEADQARFEGLLAKNAATPRERDEAQARAAAARAGLLAARDNLAYAVLRAPFAGTVAARPANLGDVAQPGQPLIEVEGQGGLELHATVEASLAARLTRGQVLWARVDGHEQPLRAVVSAVAQAGDPATQRFELRADVDAAPGLRSGVFARLLVPGAGGEPRLTIPAAAAFARGGLTGVFVAEQGRARLRFIAPGAAAGDALEVRAGLSAGERVVLDPQGLQDGAPVVSAETR
jgi:RND family efflux transporter MFP subunit